MRTKLRGVLMAGNLAEEQINNAGCDFDRYNGEFVRSAYTVGCAYLPNDGNFVLQNSCGCENLHSEHTVVHPLTTATNEAKTRMNRVFAGGGGI